MRLCTVDVARAACALFWHGAVFWDLHQAGVPSLHSKGKTVLVQVGLSSAKQVCPPCIGHLRLRLDCTKQVSPPCMSRLHHRKQMHTLCGATPCSKCHQPQQTRLALNRVRQSWWGVQKGWRPA